MLTLDRLQMPTVLVDVSPIQPLVPHRLDAFTSTVRAKLASLRTTSYPDRAAKAYRPYDTTARIGLPIATGVVGMLIAGIATGGLSAALLLGGALCLGIIPVTEGAHRDGKRRDLRDASYDLMSAELADFEDFLANEAKNAPAELCSALVVSAKALADEAALADNPIIRARTRAALQYFTHLVGPDGGAARAQLRDQPKLY